MSKLFQLVKVNLIEYFRLNKIFKKEKILQKILILFLVLIGVLAVGFSLYSIYYSTLFMAPDPNTALETTLRVMISTASLGLIIANFSQVYGYLFKGKDYDLLVSMPIPTRLIVLSKIITIIVSNLFFMFIAIVPGLILIGISGLETSFIFYFNSVIIIAVFPLGILSIFGLISYLIMSTLKNMKHSNIITIVAALILITLYLVFSLSLGTDNVEVYNKLGNIIEYIYYPGVLAVNTLLGSFSSLVLMIVFNLGIFMIFIYVISKLYFKFNTGIKRRTDNKTSSIKVKKSSPIKVLTRNEFKRYFSIPVYVLNTIFGKLLLPIGMILVSLNLTKNMEMPEAMPIDLNEVTYLLIALLAVFTITLTSTTSVTISIEGKEFWILKSLPVEPMKIFISKMLVDLLTTYIPAIVGIIGMLIFLRPLDIVGTLLIIILIILLGLHNAISGLLVNLKFPKMDWDLPIRPVKQSASVVIHMVITFIILVASSLLSFYVYGKTSGVIYSLLVIIGFYAILLPIEIILLNKFGKKWFMKI